MKKRKHVIAAVILGLTLIPAYGQPGAHHGDRMGARHGPQMGGAMAKVFGGNSTFTATMEMQSDENANGGALVGKMS